MENEIKSLVKADVSTNSIEYKIDSSISNKNKWIYLISSLFLAVLFDRFFLTGMPGISLTIFTLFYIASFYIFNKEDINSKNPVGLFALFSLVVSALNYGIYSNPFMEFLNFLAIPMLCTAGFALLRYNTKLWERLAFLGEIFYRIIISPIINIVKPFSFLKEIVTKSKVKMDGKKKSIIAGIVISIIMLMIVIPLLSSADMVFNYYLLNIANAFKINNFSEIIFHGIFIFLLFIYVFGYMLSFKYPPKVINESSTGIKKWINPVTAATSLIPLSFVYLLFSVIQFSYLYGKSGLALSNGFTYAEYARRGFFELVTVTAINFAIIIFTTHFSDTKTDSQKRLLNILLTLLIIFTFNMLFSANYKLSLYEGAYGFTYLRFFVHGFILLIFILLIFVLLGIWVKKINILKVCLIISIAFFTALNMISPDRIIAQRNIERYNTTGKIDVQYLSSLSSDSIPLLVDFSNSSSQKAKEMKNLLIEKKAKLRPLKWYEFNFSINRAYNILKNYN